jgi:hypothetical protein
MCSKSSLELAYDTKVRDDLASLCWGRLRLLDASLIPWDYSQKMTDVNPNTLNANHPIHKCYPPFWVKDFTVPSKHSRSGQRICLVTFCLEQNRWESRRFPTSMTAQLACSFFEPEQFVALVFETNHHG